MVVAAAFFAAGAAQAQSLPDLKAYLDTIRTDVVATGGLAFNHEGNALFIPDGDRRSFPSQLAVDREVLKKINANCVVNGMFYSVDEMCKADISAEITFNGPTANLLIFEVNNLQPPKGK